MMTTFQVAVFIAILSYLMAIISNVMEREQ